MAGTPFPGVPQTYKDTVRLATTPAGGNLSLSGTVATIDGVAPVNHDRILVKDQTTVTQNGIYYYNTGGAWARAADLNWQQTTFPQHTIRVAEGTANRDTEWSCMGTGNLTPGTSNLIYARSEPSYDSGEWGAVWSPGVLENMDRDSATGSMNLPTAATTLLSGGLIVPAGRTVSTINVFWITAGATYTIRWFALVRQSDRAVQAVTANATTTPTGGAVLSTNFTAAWTPNYDTPVWAALSVASSTLGVVSATVAGQAALNFVTPIRAGNSATTPTATPPTTGTVLAAPTAGQTQRFYCYLS